MVKADGLAAGKGVVLAKSKEEAIAVSSEMFSGKMLGEAGFTSIEVARLDGDTANAYIIASKS